MTDQPLSLQSFLGSLDRRLQEMSPDEIRGTLLRHAQGLQGADREAFLAIFTAPGPVEQGEGSLDLTWPIEHDPLLDEIDAFVERVAAGEYFQGFGWDDELYDERSFGDESWVWELDGFLVEAQEAFLAGKLGLARAAYQRLLAAFALDEEGGTFSGPEAAPEMVETDLVEAQARYLRTIYETTPAEERATVLAQTWLDLLDWNVDVSLAAVRESRSQDLPDFEQFLPAWINALRSLDSGGPQLRKLLTEATQLFSGVDGLGDLARQAEHDQAEHYLQWVHALRRAERPSDGINAADEALQVLETGGSTQALIAEELAELSRGDATQVLQARRRAWRAAPTQARLLALHKAATHASEAAEVMAGELEALEASGDLDGLAGGLHASLAILAGRVDEMAHVLNQPTDHVRRSAHDVLVPYLLVSGCSGPRHADWPSTRLAKFLTTVDLMTLWGGITDFGLAGGNRPSGDIPPLSELFIQQISAQHDTDEVLAKRLDAAAQVIEREADDIVSSKARRQYASAAQLLVCCAEALTLANRAEAGANLVQQWKTRYSRHSAFQRELRTAIEQTSVLATGEA